MVQQYLTSVKIESAPITDSWKNNHSLRFVYYNVIGDGSLIIGSKSHDNLAFDGCHGYSGIVTLQEGVQSVFITFNDAKSISPALRMLHKLPKTVEKIYVYNEEHFTKIPSNLKKQMHIKEITRKALHLVWRALI